MKEDLLKKFVHERDAENVAKMMKWGASFYVERVCCILFNFNLLIFKLLNACIQSQGLYHNLSIAFASKLVYRNKF